MKLITKPIILFLFIFSICTNSKAQNDSSLNQISITSEIVNPVTHWVKYVQGKNYTCWTVLEENQKCTYIIERSTDKIDWEAIGYKEGYKSPSNIPLAYYFIDEFPCEGNNYYRLRRLIISIPENTSYSFIKIIPLITE